MTKGQELQIFRVL